MPVTSSHFAPTCFQEGHPHYETLSRIIREHQDRVEYTQDPFSSFGEPMKYYGDDITEAKAGDVMVILYTTVNFYKRNEHKAHAFLVLEDEQGLYIENYKHYHRRRLSNFVRARVRIIRDELEPLRGLLSPPINPLPQPLSNIPSGL